MNPSRGEHEELGLIPAETVAVVRFQSIDATGDRVAAETEAIFQSGKEIAPEGARFPADEEILQALSELPESTRSDVAKSLHVASADAFDTKSPCYHLRVFVRDSAEPAGVALRDVYLVRCTDIDRFLAARPPVDLALVGRLPGGRAAYFGGQCDDGFHRALAEFYQRIGKTIRERAELKRLDKLFEAGRIEWAACVTRPVRIDWGIRLLQLTRAGSPASLMEFSKLDDTDSDKDVSKAFCEAEERFRGRPVDACIEERSFDHQDSSGNSEKLGWYGYLANATDVEVASDEAAAP